ncbi:hypothetical protein [Candidatus Pelagibacter sp. HIMB1746]|uniref:hypothetical protein n=1 Tax=unclassified Candidatus Pelagibacter TaxID=2647897 RepID=UPI003F87B579
MKIIFLMFICMFLTNESFANEIKIPKFKSKEDVFFCKHDSGIESMLAITRDKMIMYYQAKGERSAIVIDQGDRYTATFEDFKMIFFKKTSTWARTYNDGIQSFGVCRKLN